MRDTEYEADSQPANPGSPRNQGRRPAKDRPAKQPKVDISPTEFQGIQATANAPAASIDTGAIQKLHTASIAPMLEATKTLRSLDLAPMLAALSSLNLAPMLAATKTLSSLNLTPMLEATTTIRSITEAARLPDTSWLAGNLTRPQVGMRKIDPGMFRDHKLEALVDLNGAMTTVASLLEKESNLVEQLVEENRLLRTDQQDLHAAVEQGRRESKRGTRWLIGLNVGLLVVGVIAAMAVISPDLPRSLIELLGRSWHWLVG